MKPARYAEPVWAIGLMSGTSLDGIDAALIKTDGVRVTERSNSLTMPFDDTFHELMSHVAQQSGDIALVEQDFTVRNIDAVHSLLKLTNLEPQDITVIGFHGQTVDHRPEQGITWQLGDAALLAAATGIDVIADFRRRDMALGGQGAPLVPLYHAAVAKNLPKPLAIVNIGGMANVTWIDEDVNNPWILAFDTGPGNALMNEMVERRTGKTYDHDGKLAAGGKIDPVAVDGYLYDTYFATPPPKSLDRYDFGVEPVLHMKTEDAIATLLEFTAQSIRKAQDFMPVTPKQWLISGGGAHNPVLMKRLEELLGNVHTINSVGLDADSMEAQAFAFLAVRCMQGMPITLPQLTGVHQPAVGGAFYRA